MTGRADGQRQLMAYFSHSYRPADNPANLYFWEMFSERGLSFAVDPPSGGRRPMDVTYLEWLMAQSACFVAVIPRREDAPSPFCSPYQLFEYRLAVRAGKPRLIFLQDDLEANLLGIDPDEVITFRRQDLEAFRGEDEKQAIAFATRVRQLADQRPRGARPIGLVTRSGDPAYADVVPRMEEVIQSTLGRSCSVIDPARFDSDYRLLQALEDCDVLVSEIRPPYLPADLYGLIHGRALPTLRIAYLAPGESSDEASAALRLAARPGGPRTPAPAVSQGWPIVLRGYQIDPSMQPVLFWNDPEDLCRRMAESLGRIGTRRTVLDGSKEARGYFQQLGRLQGKVFISNAHAQNDLAGRITAALRDKESISVFHYTDDNRDPSRPNWKDEVRGEIELCTQLVALIDEGFNASPWCEWETEVAVDLFKEGRLELLTYKIGTDRIPWALRGISKHVQEIQHLPAEEKVASVVRRVVESFERGRRVRLEDSERSRILEILAAQPRLSTAEGLEQELQAAGLPAVLSERAQRAADLGEAIDILAAHPTWIQPWKTALGLFLTSVTRDAAPADRELVWNLCRLRSLMPDVRYWVEPPAVTRELGLGLEYSGAGGTVGIFTGIHQGRLEGWQPAAERTGGPPLPGLVDLVAGQPKWQSWVDRIGGSIVSGPPFAPFQEKYRQAVGPAAEGEGLLGLCVASGPDGLRVPVEWATFDGLRAPLALKHPVRRYLLDAPRPRPTLRWMLTQGKPAPVRVLIVGAHAGDLPAVDHEIEAVRELYARWFARMGWPLSDLTVIGPGGATSRNLKAAIRDGGYQVLHFAGHAWTGGAEPALAVADSAAQDQLVALPASMLAEWVTRSDLRLVYLSSCRGSGEAVEEAGAIHRFESLAEAMVPAGVPEVAGFRWPIFDGQSRLLAERFHEAYLRAFDASIAMFDARCSAQTAAQIWAAAVVIAQHDSPGE